MSSTRNDSLGLSQLHSILPSPPNHEPIAQNDVKAADNSDCSHSPWLLRRTSIHVESTHNEAWQDDNSSHRGIAPSLRSTDEKNAMRSLLTRFSNKPAEDHSEDGRTYPALGQSHDSSDFGTRVFIEASKPAKAHRWERHEMKGLEQAASVKRWPGSGNPAEPWGKLAKVYLMSILLLTMWVAKLSRTLSYGIPVEIHWHTMATSARKLRSVSDHQS